MLVRCEAVVGEGLCGTAAKKGQRALGLTGSDEQGRSAFLLWILEEGCWVWWDYQANSPPVLVRWGAMVRDGLLSKGLSDGPGERGRED